MHVHNKLVSSLTLTADERRFVADEMVRRLNASAGPTHVILPLGGVEAWDREGEVGHAPEDLAAFHEKLESSLGDGVGLSKIPCHINDAGFVAEALRVFDHWLERGLVPRPASAEGHRALAGA